MKNNIIPFDSMIKPKKRKIKFNYVLIGLIVSVIFNVAQYFQNKSQIEDNRLARSEVDSIKYIENGLSFRPRLDLVGSPEIKFYKLKNVSKEIFNPFYESQKYNDTTNTVTGKMEIVPSYKFINNGNSLCKIKFYTVLDTFTNASILRTKILDAIQTGKIKIENMDSYFKATIPADSTVQIEIPLDLQFIKEDRANLHFIIYYENELGNLYDTYVWAEIENIPLIYRPKIGYNKQKKMLYGTLEEMVIKDKFKCAKVNTDTKLYDRITAKEIINYLDTAKIKTSIDTNKIKTKTFL